MSTYLTSQVFTKKIFNEYSSLAFLFRFSRVAVGRPRSLFARDKSARDNPAKVKRASDVTEFKRVKDVAKDGRKGRASVAALVGEVESKRGGEGEGFCVLYVAIIRVITVAICYT